MKNNLLQVVIDTNVIIRAASSRSLANPIFIALLNQKFVLCITTEILLEYEEKLVEIYDIEVAELVIGVLMILPNVKRVETFYNLRLIISDVDDDKFVDCAFASNAHYIVSEDRHFKILKKIDFPHINIIKFDQFKQILNSF